MMRTTRRTLVTLLVLLLAASAVTAQDSGDPTVQIAFPPPVFVLSGQAQIAGTANAAGQVNYFIEYQPIADNFQAFAGQEDTWLPATLPSSAPVTDGQLGVWDTTAAGDGLYAIRLTVATQNGPIFDVVSPIRVDNSGATGSTAPPAVDNAPLDTDPTVNDALLALTATSEAFNNRQSGTPVPDQGAAAPSDGMTAEVLIVANLRAGDSTSFDVIIALEPGTQLEVLGRSPRGTNWLFVRTPQGIEGWVAPSVVNLSGLLTDVPTTGDTAQQPVATQPPAPTSNEPDGNVVSIQVDRQLTQGVPFQVIVTVRNDGGVLLPTAPILCNVAPQDLEVTFTGGNLQPGAQGQFVVPLRVNTGGGADIDIACIFDPANTIPEADESNNTNNAVFPLAAS